LTDAELILKAETAAGRAYCPYSHFRVGAVVEAAGLLFAGCNVENASYGLTACAERVAVFLMAAHGVRRFGRLAVACPDAPEGSPPGARMPCGACLQVLSEFAAPGAVVVVADVGRFRLDALLPVPFALQPQRTS
jgi:cytidine deaminase